MPSDKQKTRIIFVLVLILAAAIVFLGYSIYANNVQSSSLDSNQNTASINYPIEINQSYPDGPTADAVIDTHGLNSSLLGSNDLGTVEVFGPFGNPDSDIKIAYLIGMHPLESKAHKALFDTVLAKNSNLNYCYYVYKTNVSNYDTDDEGRMDGQLLAQEFVRPHVIDGDYDLVVDVHSNKGMISGTYEETNFIFAVGQDEKSEVFVNKLLQELPELVYYFPAAQSSPPYITIPIEESGTPTINYETYCYEPINTTYDLMDKFVDAVDNLNFEELTS